jgi:TPR repeat protein
MRISDCLIPICALTLGLNGAANAFDGTASNGAATPAVNVDIVARGAATSPPMTSAPATAAPTPPAALSAPGATLAGAGATRGAAVLRPPLDLKNKPSPIDAFRSGTMALRAGDTKSGVTALEYAAANGHPMAQWKLGRMYADGDGVGRDDVRAFEYFRDIAATHADDVPGTPQARFVGNAFVALGLYYLDGVPNSPIKADPERAREVFHYAASYFGDADAQYNLGRLYLDGNGTAKEPKLAARWLGLAANKGQYQAQAVLGAMLFKGNGVPRQAARGLMWLTLASDSALPQEKWIRELHDAAFKQATDDERQLALVFLERRLNGRRD